MGKNLAEVLQQDIVALFKKYRDFYFECKDLEKVYFSTDASTYVSGLGTDSTAATHNTLLTKVDYTNGITSIQQFTKLIDDQVVAQVDNLSNMNNVMYGSAISPGVQSAAVEDVADRMKLLFSDMVLEYKSLLFIVDCYFDNEYGDIVAVLDAHRTMPGMDVNQFDLAAALTFIQEVKDYYENVLPTKANYSITLATWERYE